MTKKNFLIALAVAFFILTITFIMDMRAKKYYAVHSPEVERAKTEAKEMIQLKKMFKNKKAVQRAIDSLKSIKTPSKDYKKGSVYVLEFDGLNVSNLRVLIRKVMNSTIRLKTFRITRQQENAGVYMEVER